VVLGVTKIEKFVWLQTKPIFVMKTTFTPELSPTAKKDGTYAVYVRIYQDAKYRRVNLGFLDQEG
jgi:hypothetical protein